MGTRSRINLKTENDQDSTTRTIKLYKNEQPSHQVQSPGSYDLSIGSVYPSGSIVILGLELIGSNIYYGKRITFNAVTYRVKRFEIDRMQKVGNTGYIMSDSETESMIDYARTYHILRGYTRFDYVIDNDYIRHDGWLSPEDYGALWNSKFDKRSYSSWEWCLIAWKDYLYTSAMLGVYYPAPEGIVIFDGACELQAGQTSPTHLAYRRTAFLHEFNHLTGILIVNQGGTEQYCPNPECVMASFNPDNPQSIKEEPWTCQYYWAERDSPWV